MMHRFYRLNRESESRLSEARAILRVVDCLILLWEHRLNAGSVESFPAPLVWSDFNYSHWMDSR
jgi:hypothetical protein